MKPPITDFWGKLEKDEAGHVIAWHPLEDHCADVAAVMEALLRTKVMRRRLARLAQKHDLSAVDIARLCALVALHDVGKVIAPFYRRAEANETKRPVAGHVKEMVAVLWSRDFHKIKDALGWRGLTSFVDGDEHLARRYLTASIAHHGRPFAVDSLSNLPRPELWLLCGGRDPIAAISGLTRSIRAWFPLAFSDQPDSLPESEPFLHMFSGLTMLADWIGSDAGENAFPFTPGKPKGNPSDSRMDFARARAPEVLGKLGLSIDSARAELGRKTPSFATIRAERHHEIRPAQKCLQKLPAESGGSITVLEAETGSGKTEAALLRFLVLFHAGCVDGLYFALPTRTAATQIHGRVVGAIARAFPDPGSRPAVVLAVPGYLRVDDVTGVRRDRFDIDWGGDGRQPHLLSSPEVLHNDDSRERYRFRGWAAEHPKRYLAGCVVVGTIDQVLLSAIKVSHAHLRASALLRHLLVVDEVHASDVYMATILEEVLHRQFQAGGHSLLMSATLGATVRHRLLYPRDFKRPHPSLAAAIAVDYPLVSHRGSGPSREASATALRDPAQPPSRTQCDPREVQVNVVPELESDEAIATRALAAARTGARVLVIRNTVSGCVSSQKTLEKIVREEGSWGLLFNVEGICAPHHSRFAREDRQTLDEELERRFGKDRSLNPGGAIVIATQTVQQSLDLDADYLITDLCPMDVLLQRIGRLHRHWRENRPAGYSQPTAEVLVPSNGTLDCMIREDGKVRGRHGFGTVYEDLRILEATHRLLTPQRTIAIPNGVRTMVEKTVHPEALQELVAGLGKKWVAHGQEVMGKTGADRRFGNLNVFRLEDTYGDFDFPRQPDERIQTRLGEGDRIAELGGPVVSPFGQQIWRLTIPAWMTRGLDEEAQVSELQASEQKTCFSFEGKRFVYDRLGLAEE